MNEVKIRWGHIKTLQSDLPVLLYLADGSRLTGWLAADGEGLYILDKDDKKSTGPLSPAAVLSINPVPAKTDQEFRFTGHVQLGYSSAAGNSETESIHAHTEMTIRTEKDRYMLGGNLRWADDRGKQTESHWLANVKYDRFLTEKWYGYGNANFEYDKFKDIRLRSALGTGMGYQPLESDRSVLSFEGGLTYIHTAYETVKDDAHLAGRWSLKFDQGLFQTRTRFFHFHEIFVGCEEIRKTFIRTQTGFRFPLMERLNATARFDLDWDNDPSPGRERTDRAVMMTLGYNW